ncbi:MAG: hypothetical protein K1X88_20155 [Nannocystaceae bacterium]|nr:hypothetical protein [Nannocystaceae bacterium]
MPRSPSSTLVIALVCACADADADTHDGSSSASGSAESGSSGGSGGSASASSASASSASASSASAEGGQDSSGGDATDTGGGGPWDAGNPDGSCSEGVPSLGQAVDTSSPTTVVGDGTAPSCTHDALAAAVAQGGIITFDCGDAPVTIAITATLSLRTDVDTVIDGGQTVTLDGQHQVRVLQYDSPNFMATATRVTLQHLRIVGGKATPTSTIPEAPPPCSQGYDDGQGGALYMRDGNLSVIDCIFEDNEAAPLGPDTGGGAIYVLGSLEGMVVAGSTFRGNHASNAGAVGGLFCQLSIYDSLFVDNAATGNGANGNDPAQCQVMHAGQNQVGSGGNGGAIYSDGQSVDVTICGTAITGNAAGEGAFGGGLFFTSNDFGGDLSIIDSSMQQNTGGSWTQAQTGDLHDAGTAVGTNCHSLTIVNSSLQGL